MKHGCYLSAAALAAVLACAGCQNGAQNQKLLEDQLFRQDVTIGCLQDELCEFEQRLDAAHRENSSLKKQLGVSDGQPYNPRKDLPTTPGKSNTGPLIEPGVPVGPGENPLLKKSSDAGGPRIMPASFSENAPGGLEMPSDQTITQLFINKMLTGGHNADGKPGDEGIMVVFEPRNAAGQLVPIPGETSIVLLDPQIDGPGAIVARWDFFTDEVLTHFKKTFIGKGLQFQLRWPNEPPQSRDLKVFVRFITIDGKKLIAEQNVHVDPIGVSTTMASPKNDRLTEPSRLMETLPASVPAGAAFDQPSRAARLQWRPNR